MGCMMSSHSREDDEANRQLELEPDQATETYEPGNMSVSRESTMAEVQFIKPRRPGSMIKVNNHGKGGKNNPNAQIKLPTIADNEAENGHHHGTQISRRISHKQGIKNLNGSKNGHYISQQDMAELKQLDLKRDPLPLPHKRCIFISIAQLNACIEEIPSYILEESIFCFKAERSWFFPSNHIERKQSRQSIRHRLNFNHKFLKILTEKDNKNLVLWLSDNKQWNNISDELVQITDLYYDEDPKDGTSSAESLHAAPTDSEEKQSSQNHVMLRQTSEPQPEDTKNDRDNDRDDDNGHKYSPLRLDFQWWLHNFKNKIDGVEPLFCESADVVVEELMACKLKFEPTRELLYQSNPTLIPMRQFDIEQYVNHHYEVVTEENDDDDDDMDGMVMLGDDMDDHDIDNGMIEPMESPQSPDPNNNNIHGMVPYSPPIHNVSSPGQILTDYQRSNTQKDIEQMTLIHVNNTQNSNTATSYKSPQTQGVNITPAPSNAPNTMKLLARDSGYEDCEDDDMIYMVDQEQLGTIMPSSVIPQKSKSNSKSRSNKLNTNKMVKFAPNESNLVAHIEHSSQRKDTFEISQSDGGKLNLYHTSATESEMP